MLSFFLLPFLSSSLHPSLHTSTVDPVVITSHPAPQVLIVPGQSASFTVTATGDNLSYQWQKDGVEISGATSATYTISSAMEGDEGMYLCVVSNAAGAVTSNHASLTVCKCVQRECLHTSLKSLPPSLSPSLSPSFHSSLLL